jgi:hypothetical protein
MRTEKQAAVLAYLQTGGSLTVIECINRFHSTELRRVISRLRKAGHRIADTFENADDGAMYKRYYLQKEIT